MSKETDSEHQNSSEEPSRPEPPARYDPESIEQAQNQVDGSSGQDRRLPYPYTPELVSASRYLLVAAIAGPLSLLIGGTLLSTIALILAIIGYRKTFSCKDSLDAASYSSARKFAIGALVVCVLTLIANIAFMIIWYPTILEWVSSGGNGQILGGGGTLGPSGSSTWG